VPDPPLKPPGRVAAEVAAVLRRVLDAAAQGELEPRSHGGRTLLRRLDDATTALEELARRLGRGEPK
jgi:hypothetical protein